MNVTHFFLIDAICLLLGLAYLLLSRVGKQGKPLSTNKQTTKKYELNSLNLPSVNELLALEKLARKDGSGIDFKDLIGLWKFVLVWKKEKETSDFIASSLLRLFSASLEFKQNSLKKDLLQFDIVNSIQFGELEIRFIGSGELNGTQPLLPFFFQCIELNLGKRVLLSRQLKAPEKKLRPFFALIAMESQGKWLSARGRGGGLALWLKEK